MSELFSKETIEEALVKAGNKLTHQVNAYLIGGCAMTFYELKPSTKDADLLFEDGISEQRLFEALKESGFEELFPGSSQIDLKAKDILINEKGLQFDLFVKQVMGGLTLSRTMKERAKPHAKYGLLNVFLASKEDIYLFKSITTRPLPRDYEDLVKLQEAQINWKALIEEYEKQIRGTPLEINLRKKIMLLKQEGITNPLTQKY